MKIVEEVLDRYDFGPCFIEQRIPPNEELVHQVEMHLGVALPSAYRAFLLKYGGFSPSGDKDATPACWVRGRNRLVAALFFLGFYRDEGAFDLVSEYERQKAVIGTTFLPIMKGAAYDVFCIKLSGENKGSIWAWLKDAVDIHEEWEDVGEVRGLYLAAADFLAFIGSFQDLVIP